MYNPNVMCLSPPINVSNNVSFLVDTSSLDHGDNIKCDDMGAWDNKGCPSCCFNVERNSRGIKRIASLGLIKCLNDQDRIPTNLNVLTSKTFLMPVYAKSFQNKLHGNC